MWPDNIIDYSSPIDWAMTSPVASHKGRAEFFVCFAGGIYFFFALVPSYWVQLSPNKTVLCSYCCGVAGRGSATRGLDLGNEEVPHSSTATAGPQFSAASQRLPTQSASPAGAEAALSPFPDWKNDPWEMFSQIWWRGTCSCWGALALPQSQGLALVSGLALDCVVFSLPLFMGSFVKIPYFFPCHQTRRTWSVHFPPSPAAESQYGYMTFFWICGFVISVDLLITAQAVPRGTRHSWGVFCALRGAAAGRAQQSASSSCPVQELLQRRRREVCWKGVCLKLNQSRNISVTFGTGPCSLNTPKGRLWVIFPLKRFSFREAVKHGIL